MMVQERRLDMRLTDKGDLSKYMRFRGYTIRTLGEAVDREIRRASKGRVQSKASWRVIAHLHSGERKTCRPETALAIERCLEAPQGFLFVAKVSPVSRPQRTAA